ncbi:hypothetical protein RRG08_049627 [Elysia crispata]|uniref:Uncharacterized protein n=1 Tax=Elysia crispata TaxID=231223 RepID=A0AAE1CQB2_9GAST|nr:hypothetical protein RRG08_049627 [Elysia crispata]
MRKHDRHAVQRTHQVNRASGEVLALTFSRELDLQASLLMAVRLMPASHGGFSPSRSAAKAEQQTGSVRFCFHPECVMVGFYLKFPFYYISIYCDVSSFTKVYQVSVRISLKIVEDTMPHFLDVEKADLTCDWFRSRTKLGLQALQITRRTHSRWWWECVCVGPGGAERESILPITQEKNSLSGLAASAGQISKSNSEFSKESRSHVVIRLVLLRTLYCVSESRVYRSIGIEEVSCRQEESLEQDDISVAGGDKDRRRYPRAVLRTDRLAPDRTGCNLPTNKDFENHIFTETRKFRY